MSPPESAKPPARCASCGGPLVSLGQIPVRAGGTKGVWIFFFQQLAEIGEKVIALDTYRCGDCGHLEFFDHDASLPRR